MPTDSPPIVITEDDDDDKDERPKATSGQTAVAADCMICYEPYSEDDNHRPAALKCGHVAGEPCLRKWLGSQKVCPSCRKTTRPRDLVPLFNLPTVMVAAGGGSGGGATPAAAAAANPTELAQKEMMLQKVQRAYSEKEKEVQRQAEEARRQKEEAQRQAREAKRRAAEVLVKEDEMKRLRRELEEAKRQLAAQGQMTATAQPPPVAVWPQGPAFPLAPTQPHHQHGPVWVGAGHGAAATGPFGGLLSTQPQGYTLAAYLPPGAAPGTQWVGVSGSDPPGAAFLQTMPPPPAAPGGVTAVACGSARQPWTALSGSMWGHFQGAPGGAPVPSAPNSSAGDGQHTRQHHQHHHHDLRQPQGGPWDALGDTAQGLQPHQHQHPNPRYALPQGGFGVPDGFGSSTSGTSRDLFERSFWVAVEGCRLLALDPAAARLLVSETRSGPGGASCIRKISMHAPESCTRIRLPPNAGIVYDMQLPAAAGVASSGGGGGGGSGFLAVTTQGAGLSLACTRSDNVVATFKGLPYKVWCCSWVPPAADAGGGGGAAAAAGANFSGLCSDHLLLAGLASGHIALLDTRRLDGPVGVLPVLQQAARPGCAQLPVRTVAAVPHGQINQEAEEASGVGGSGGVVWPSCVLSCVKGAWLMLGGAGGGGGTADAAAGAGGGGAAAAAEAPALVCLDGPLSGGGAQLESVSVHHSSWGSHSGAGDGTTGQPWRVVLSWRPADTGQPAGGVAGLTAAGPRHEVGWLRASKEAPYSHEATVMDYTRRRIQSVRSCLLPPPVLSAPAPHDWDGGGGGPGEVLLASSDDDTRQPLIWSLRRRADGPGGGGTGGCYARVVQRLEPHPEPPACMAAAGGGGGGPASADCFLGCASHSRVVLYRRRGG